MFNSQFRESSPCSCIKQYREQGADFPTVSVAVAAAAVMGLVGVLFFRSTSSDPGIEVTTQLP